MPERDSQDASPRRRRVVIIGGGFAGLNAARALRKADAEITLVDRRNHHVFQPLLYQVATAALAPSQVAVPIREIFARQANMRVILGEAVRVEPAARRVVLADGELHYDYLLVAAGATHQYFGHAEWETLAPGLKTIEEALEIRRRFLLAFERAERAQDERRRRALTTFVVIGGGPTGVEMAGAIAEIARTVLRREFRSIDTATARVMLVEAGDRLLPTFPIELTDRARRDLTQMGVEVRLGQRVGAIEPGKVSIGGETIECENIIWAAGVRASPLAQSLGAALDPQGRVAVKPDLSIEGRPEIFVVGDLARVEQSSGQPVPGVAQGAIQMGRHAGRTIAAEIRGGTDLTPVARPAFRYVDFGSLATIGRSRAVADVRGIRFAGRPAWLFWALVHVMQLIGFRNRFTVMFQWAWDYAFFARGSRLITQGAIQVKEGATLEPKDKAKHPSGTAP